MNRVFHLKTFAFLFIALNMIFLLVDKSFAQIDLTFGTNGVTKTNLSGKDSPIGGFVLPDGKILVVAENGIPNLTSYYFLRYNADGTPDATYGDGGKILLSIPFQAQGYNYWLVKAARQPDGKIVLAGSDNNSGIILRFNENGTLDTSFAGGGIHRPNIINGRDGITGVVLQPDGKIVVAGFAEGALNREKLYLLRYNSNGTLDETFGTEGYIVHSQFWVTNSGIPFIFLQSNGKIVVVSPNEPDSSPNGCVRRFNSNGTVDTSYSIAFPQSGFKTAFMQPDDKILLGKYVAKTESLERTHTDSAISRYNADGSPDGGLPRASGIG
ncbi:MAG TPA: hypothetical protein VGC76_00310 [Pyrinomonadaceae bacterium]|jgi:uncharacterized delta-60 repeat protein